MLSELAASQANCCVFCLSKQDPWPVAQVPTHELAATDHAAQTVFLIASQGFRKGDLRFSIRLNHSVASAPPTNTLPCLSCLFSYKSPGSMSSNSSHSAKPREQVWRQLQDIFCRSSNPCQVEIQIACLQGQSSLQ